MYKIAILVPVYYHDEEVATCLMQLMRSNYNNIQPTLYIPITGIRESFNKSFLANYIASYSKRSEVAIDPVFDDIIPIYDNSTFDPTIMMNDIVESNDTFDYVAIVEPLISFESLNWLSDLLNIHIEYDYKRKLGAICTNNKSHKLKTSDNIRWFVDDWIIIRSLNGDGFGNGVMLTRPVEWKLVGGLKSKDYTNTYAISCFRKNHLVVYAEGVR
jgi:hypothetical protein